MTGPAAGHRGQSDDDREAALLINGGDDDAGGPLSLDDALDRVGVGPLQYQVMAVSGLGYAGDTAALWFVAFLIDDLEEAFDVGDVALSFVSTVGSVGVFLGALVFGAWADRFGRRPVFLASVAVAAAASLLSVAAHSLAVFMACRFVAGLGLGGSLAVDFTYCVEYMPLRHRGRLMMLLTMFGVCGVAYVGLMAETVLPSAGWRWYCVGVAAPSVLLLFLRSAMPESPRFLLAAGRADEALEVLRYAAARNGRQLPPGVELRPVDVVEARPWRDLWQPPLRAVSSRLVFVWGFMSLGFSGLTLWLPRLLEDAGVSASASFMLMAAAEVPGLLAAMYFVDSHGRRRVMVVTMALTAVSAIAMGQAPAGALTTVAACGIYAFVVGAWATLYIITPESMPTPLRGRASALFSACSCVGGMLSAPLGAWVMKDHPDSAVALLYGAFFLCASGAAYSLPKETAGEPLEDC